MSEPLWSTTTTPERLVIRPVPFCPRLSRRSHGAGQRDFAEPGRGQPRGAHWPSPVGGRAGTLLVSSNRRHRTAVVPPTEHVSSACCRRAHGRNVFIYDQRGRRVAGRGDRCAGGDVARGGAHGPACAAARWIQARTRRRDRWGLRQKSVIWPASWPPPPARSSMDVCATRTIRRWSRSGVGDRTVLAPELSAATQLRSV